MNTLESYLTCEALQNLFDRQVARVSTDTFVFRTKTHRIEMKRPKLVWENPYTEPNKSKIDSVDSPEVSVAKTSIERKEVLFNAVAHIENYPDLALFGSVILDTDIPVEKMATSGNFKYELTYHTYDFGSGEDIEIYDESKTLSDKEWNAMFQQGVPTINTTNPIYFVAQIDAKPLKVNKLVEFVIPNTQKKLVIDVNTERENCLVDITVASFDGEDEDALIHIDNFDKPEELLTAIYTDGDEPTDIYRKKL